MESFSVTGKCHTLHRFDIYECLMLQVNSEVDEDIALLDRYIMSKFERDHHNFI